MTSVLAFGPVRRILLSVFLVVGLVLAVAWSGSAHALAAAQVLTRSGTDGVHDLDTGQTFATIQAAVNAANPGDTLRADPGTYNEDVFINKRLTLQGAQHGVDPGAVLPPPAAQSILTGTGVSAPIVKASGVSNVTIDGFTVQSPATGSGALNAGIYIPGGTGITVKNNVIQNNTAGVVELNAAVSIQHNLIQTNNRPGSGSGNGISFVTTSSSSLPTVISDNHFFNETTASVLLAPAPGQRVSNVTASGNVLVNSAGFALIRSSAIIVSGNSETNLVGSPITNMGGSGIYLGGGDSGVTVDGNTVVNSGAGLHVVRTFDIENSDLQILNNTFEQSVTYGIFVGPGSLGSSTIANNHVVNSGIDGISMASGTNTLTSNQASNSATLDCADVTTGNGTAGTDNTWQDNLGQTASPLGICLPPPLGFHLQPGSGTDVGVGAHGSVWIVGTNPMPGGFGLWHFTGTTWSPVAGGAVRIAVDQNGHPWIVNSLHQIFRFNGAGFVLEPGSANDVGVGADGSVWIVGTNPMPGGFGLWHFTGSTWSPVAGGAVDIAVNQNGNPWIVNSLHQIFRSNGTGFMLLPGSANDIGVGAHGSAWIVGTNPMPGGFGLWHFTGSTWSPIAGGAVRIAVNPSGNPWIVSSLNQIFFVG